MTSALFDANLPIDVAVIGGGPSGLAAATALKAAGVARVVVLEREAEAGGIPRHCGHHPFGMREFNRVLKGPDYAARLVDRARKAGVEIHTLCTVVEALPHGRLSLSVPGGTGLMAAKRVIYATGSRETPRSARLISGARVGGVLNTGSLQAMVYLKGLRPFERPVIIGSELVAFSALMTCAHASIRPAAMIESAMRATARWPIPLFARMQGVPLMTGTTLLSIEGGDKVEAVRVRTANGETLDIDCDGVVLTGVFTPESALARCGHLAVDAATGGPVVDQWGRCSDPAYFATGNVLRPVETAGWCWAEGRRAGNWVAKDLENALPRPASTVPVIIGDRRLKYVVPQQLGLFPNRSGMDVFQLRVREPVSGHLIACCNGKQLFSQRMNSCAERRITVPIEKLRALEPGGVVSFLIEPVEKPQDRAPPAL